MNEAQHLEEKSESVAVEQQSEPQERAEQQTPDEKGEEITPAPTAPGRKKRKKKAPPRVEDITPRPSFWPILLAFAICVTFAGMDIHPVVIVLGVLLVITAIIGWGVERR